MRLLLFGATGYVGAHLVPELQAQGHTLHAFVRNSESAAKLATRDVPCTIGDLLDEALDFRALFTDVDGIVFAPQLLVGEENVVVTAMLDALEGSNKTFIFTSGTGVLAQRTDGWWSEDSFAEDDEFVPLKYLAARVDTEKLVRASPMRGIRGMIVRPPGIWGNGGSGIIKSFFLSAARSGKVCYLGPGLNLYTHVHVEDLARLFALALEKGVAGALYHAVAGELNNRSLAEAIAKRLGLETRSVNFDEGDRIWGRFSTLISFSMCSRTKAPRSRQDLGWSPEHRDILDDLNHPTYLSLTQPG